MTRQEMEDWSKHCEVIMRLVEQARAYSDAGINDEVQACLDGIQEEISDLYWKINSEENYA